MSIFSKAADVAYKSVNLTLLSLLGFQIYQIAKFTSEKRALDTKYHHMNTREKLDAAIEKDAARMDKANIDKMGDVYDEEDDTYIKAQPKIHGQTPTK